MKTSFQDEDLTNNTNITYGEWLWQLQKIFIRQFIQEN